MNIGKTGNFRVTVENTVGKKLDCHLQEQIRPGLWKTVDTKTVPFIQLALLDFEKRVEKEEAKIGA